MAEGRTIAGIHCFEVLERLDDYVADELAPGVRQSIDSHLRECDWCTQFGGRYADTVRQLREALATEMLEALGVDTSKTFSLIETGERLWRGDEPSPTRSSVLVRLAEDGLQVAANRDIRLDVHAISNRYDAGR